VAWLCPEHYRAHLGLHPAWIYILGCPWNETVGFSHDFLIAVNFIFFFMDCMLWVCSRLEVNLIVGKCSLTVTCPFCFGNKNSFAMGSFISLDCFLRYGVVYCYQSIIVANR
jgi:hypothetical protein